MPKSTRNIGLSELRVGLLVLIAIAVLILLILNASGTLNPFASHIHLRARFADASGLREGSEVRLAGVRIGKVDRIRLLSPSEVGTGPSPQKVEAFLTIESKIDGVPAPDRIRTDSTAQQMAPSILGSEMIVNITPGTPLGQQIKENDLLPSTSGSSISDLATNGTELAQKLSKLSDQLNEVVKNVRDGKGTVGRLFNDEALYNNLNATIRDAEELATQIKSGKGSAGKFVYDEALYNNANEISANLRKVSADLAAGRGSAGKLLQSDEMYNRITRIADRVNHSMDQIDSIVAGVNSGQGTLGKLVKDEAIYNDARTAIARFNTTAARIDSVVAGAQRGEGTLGKLITDDQLYSNVNNLSSEGVKLMYDFRQNPKKYLTIKFQLF
ncbi:MAG: phospholipid/cholesterol/gamma-HCH transport system substrate-binding protein [Blastocatellia bacterium]|jgi:phospholipid/cholesterol/gamma-HCH transport system substrate-binding protein|nr:phospholipid/cholesterol/gamma-HCH transport system substrate-binding protein [Blastocatellia bacterium]